MPRNARELEMLAAMLGCMAFGAGAVIIMQLVVTP